VIRRFGAFDVISRLDGILPRWVGELAVGVLCLAVVIIARLAVDALAPGVAPFGLMYPAALVATLVAGARAGVGVAATGGLLSWFAVVPPARSFVVESPADAIGLVIYAVSVVLVIALAQAFRQSSAELLESDTRFRLVAENAPVNLWMGDEKGACLYLNKAQREFWGVGDDFSAFNWSDSLLEEDAPQLYSAFNEAMAAQKPFNVEARYRRADGEARVLWTRAHPRFSAEGKFVGMIGVNVDMTETRQAEARQRLLLDELNHRVKNTLASVQSLAHQTLKKRAPAEALNAFEMRLGALAAAHDILTRESWQSALLADVVAQAVRPYDGSGRPRFVIEGPPTRIGPAAALGLSMALHELATNAAKYGALSNETGWVEITWTAPDAASTELSWREKGGPAVSAPKRKGFGTRLLQQGLSGDLGDSAGVVYEPDGVTCSLRVPVSAAA